MLNKSAKIRQNGKLMKFLRKWRKERHLSLNDLARLTGLSPQTLHNLEANVKDPSWSTLKKLEAAGLSRDQIDQELQREFKE